MTPSLTAEPEAPADPTGDEVKRLSREEWAAMIWEFSGRPEEQPPLPPIVRIVTAEESARVYAECMAEHGLVITVDEDAAGWASESIPPEQAYSGAVADFTCKTQYPPDPRTTQPYNQAQLEHWFQYMVDEVTPCVEARGFAVEQPPTMETWIAGYRSGAYDRWHPYNGLRDRPQSEQRDVEQECPIMPEDFYDLATDPGW